jgi:hypothetical protein
VFAVDGVELAADGVELAADGVELAAEFSGFSLGTFET